MHKRSPGPTPRKTVRKPFRFQCKRLRAPSRYPSPPARPPSFRPREAVGHSGDCPSASPSSLAQRTSALALLDCPLRRTIPAPPPSPAQPHRPSRAGPRLWKLPFAVARLFPNPATTGCPASPEPRRCHSAEHESPAPAGGQPIARQWIQASSPAPYGWPPRGRRPAARCGRT